MNDSPRYPWKEGDPLFAAELNAAIANAGPSGGPFLPLSGNTTMTGAVNVSITGYTREWVGQSTNEKFFGPVQSDNAGVIARRTDVYNDTADQGQGTRHAYYTKATLPGNDISHTDIMIVNATTPPGVASVLAYTSQWMVHVSPHDNAGKWWSLGMLVNPTHRGDDLGWTSVAGTRSRYTGGISVVPELSDFVSDPIAGGTILFAYTVGCSYTGTHVAQSYNGMLMEQNSIAPNGRGIYIGGYAAKPGVPTTPPYAPLQAGDAWQYGIDFSTATFTQAAFRSPGFEVSNAGRVTVDTGIFLNNKLAGTPTDLVNNGIDFYAGQYGINIQGFTMNLVVGGVAIGVLNSSLNGMFSAGMLGINGVTGPTWTSGPAAPASVQPVGSLYSRTGAWAAGTTLYVSKGGGVWTAVSGV
jgi:hypothetical protein